uniref:DNA primase n=1 Tax=Syphacia muris TaxID=451379 RepID=A0A0N5AUB5_9BILA
MNFEPAFLKQNLTEYYKRLFPLKPFYKWMCYGEKPASCFSLREFAFILEDDVHLRYRSFNDGAELEKELCKVAPHKLDIGAIYNHRPKDNKKYADFSPVQRELVFDIDLTDYDDVRKCCSEAKVCKKCWRWIVIAVKVMDSLLKNHFGFKHCLWVFSGRRGVHCWVADKSAKLLSNMGRCSVAEYLSLITGNTKTVAVKSKKGFVHPLIEDVYRIIMESGEVDEMVLEQGWMEDGEIDRLISSCGNVEVKSEISDIIENIRNESSCAKRWTELKKKLDPCTFSSSSETEQSQVASKDAVAHFQGFVLYNTYPRLDVNVSTNINHLLKSPFCVHPKTGCVAVPVTVDQVANLNINSIPRVELVFIFLFNSLMFVFMKFYY